jgi:hypothetical protein
MSMAAQRLHRSGRTLLLLSGCSPADVSASD